MAEVATGFTVSVVDSALLRARQGEFEALLEDAVASGASIGYLLPVSAQELGAFWQGVAAEMDQGVRQLLICEREDRVVGAVQVALCGKPNGLHRADIEKLLVQHRARRGGIGTMLMRAAEAVAQAHGRWLLLLDTREGSAGDALYRRLGWSPFGRVYDYACDPDGTLAECVFFMKRLEGAPA